MRYAFKPERSELKTTIKEMNVPVAFGISKAIKEKGFKQTYVAESAGYTPQELSDMLNGRRLIKACDIPRIAKALRSEYFNKTVDKYATEPYNYDIEKAQVKTLSEFKKEFGIEWRELN